LDEDTDQIHVSERSCPQMKGGFRPEKPQEYGDNEGAGEMHDSIGKPCDDVEDGMCESCEDVGNVGTVQHGFQSG